MYEQFFGLSEKPFQQTPDPDYFFPSRVHKQARSYLDFGLHQGEGFIVVTGEIGSGKTTLLRGLLRKIMGGPYAIAHLVSTHLEPDELLRLIALEFDLDVGSAGKSGLLLALREFFMQCRAQGRRVLLIIDEAQNLPVASLEELRMLSNFDEGDQSPLQCLLIGQVELRDTLRRPELRRLRQRVGAANHLRGMDEEDVGRYIAHRLQRAGGAADRPAFTPAACRALHAATDGIPRLLNMICDRLLITAYLDELDTLDDEHVAVALAELQAEFTQGTGDGNGAAADASAPAETAAADLLAVAARPPANQAWAEQQVLELENRLSSLEQSNVEIRKGMGVLVREMRRLLASRKRERERQREKP
ncbi:MAG: AAA family ATPase [Burkholderiaceae bacterium]